MVDSYKAHIPSNKMLVALNRILINSQIWKLLMLKIRWYMYTVWVKIKETQI